MINITEYINNLSANVVSGEVDALKAFIELKEIENALNEAKKKVQDSAILEAQKYGSKTFERFNATITLKQNPGRWNFKGYDAWNNKQNEIKDLEEKMKTSYQMSLKGSTYLDGDEIIPPAEFINGGEGISISFKK